ncbi:MAG: hypothetical protein JSR79_14565, partial [Proteobacteria bacterium]|nr:hypothetical protein [Pseudomonadota bacterium]
KCDCGCASIDFTIAGVPSDPAIPLEPFGEFISKDKRFGVFVFAKEGRLAGVEIYPLADMDLPAEFPNPDEFVSVEEGG